MYFISQDRYEKELRSLQQEVEEERTHLQEAEVRMIRNLEETVELSTQRLHRLKQKKVTIKICLICPFITNELVQLLLKNLLVFFQFKITQHSTAPDHNSRLVSSVYCEI